jgi:hypothetical protein
MTRLGAAAAGFAVAALAVAPSALGHGSVRPTVTPPGSTREFTFLIANGRDDAGMVGFSMELPAGASLDDVTARQPEWIASSSGRRVEWRGGPIPARAFESFTLRASMPDREGTASFVGRELFDDGPGPPFRLDVVLAGGGGATGDGEATDEGARTLGKAALFISIAALILAAAGFLLGLGRWLRGG